MKRNICRQIDKILIIFFVFILSSCATTVNIEVTRPAKYDLCGAKTIAVIPFQGSNYNPFDYFYEGTSDSVDSYENYGYLRYAESEVINYLATYLKRGLKSSPYITLVDSDSVKQAMKYGGKNPADVFINGEIISFRVHDFEKEVKEEIRKDNINDSEYEVPNNIIEQNGNPDEPIYIKKILYLREIQLIFNYEIIESKSKQIITHDTVKIEKVTNAYEDFDEIPNPFALVELNLQEFCESLLKDIQPYKVNKSITLLEDKTDNPLMERAENLAEDGYLKESYKQFLEVYMDVNQFEAGYNAAMILQALGQLDNAEMLMKEVYNKYGDKRALDGLYDIQNEIKQAQLLENQINHIK